jgi:hypothetical protein
MSHHQVVISTEVREEPRVGPWQVFTGRGERDVVHFVHFTDELSGANLNVVYKMLDALQITIQKRRRCHEAEMACNNAGIPLCVYLW